MHACFVLPERGTWTPMTGHAPKTTEKDWIDAARRTLIDEGIGGVKIDRLAKRLGVTRSGFYRYFKDRDEFLDLFIAYWEATCRFLPEEAPPVETGEAIAWFERIIARLIHSDGYDYRFDLAVREWARADKRAGWAIERMDRERLEILQRFFCSIGYDEEFAAIRARVFYYHQIGFFAIGVRQSTAERSKHMRLYIDILCGGYGFTDHDCQPA